MQTYPSVDGESLVIEGKDNYVFQLTTVDNELDSLSGNYNNEYNLSMIDLDKCEEYLKAENGIDPSLSLIFLKFEKLTGVAAEKNVQYEVYEPINKTKLNLQVCKNTSIDLYLPISLKEKTQNLYNELKAYGYDLFDINDTFYINICAQFTSENGTDVVLSDRINNYYTNETACQGNCQYSEYFSETKYLKCECHVVEEKMETVNMEKFSGIIFLESFYQVLKFSNYKVLKCYNLVFNNNVISKNLGSILVFVYFALYSPFLFIFIFKGISPLKIDTINVIEKTNTIDNRKKKSYNSSVDKPLKNLNKEKDAIKKENIKKNRIIKKSKTISNIKNKLRDSKKKRMTGRKKTNFPPNRKNIFSKTNIVKNKNSDKNINNQNHFHKRNSQKLKYRTKVEKNYIKLENNSQITIKINNNSINSKRTILDKKNSINIYNLNSDKKLTIKEEKLDDYELNELEYLEAIELDKRPFSQIYWVLLKRNQLILFTFFSCDDYNLYYVKFPRFIFLVCTDMAMNVFFFTDDSMHKIYLNYGKYNFVQQIPQIVYSTLLSQLLEIFLCYLCFTDKHIYQIKKIKMKGLNKDEVLKILKCIKLKLIGFFVFISVLFAFYWYIIACFCAVYENTQIIFIKDSISSFLTGLILPFIIYLFPAVLRVIALNHKKKGLKCVYKLSDIIPIF